MINNNLKVALTGHTGEVGLALSKVFSAAGHTVIGISRSTGFDLTDSENYKDIISTIDQCDVFINCCKLRQDELLRSVWELWQGFKNKRIINISSISTSDPAETNEYYQAKRKLESTFWELIKINQYPPMTIVRAGLREHDPSYDNWARFLINLLNNSEYHFLEVSYFKL
jgi:NAD(P)-dependent dehydrogenase (short-subunit alcohol dehydrogenase family)